MNFPPSHSGAEEVFLRQFELARRPSPCFCRDNRTKAQSSLLNQVGGLESRSWDGSVKKFCHRKNLLS
jgi:hypothetical protein